MAQQSNRFKPLSMSDVEWREKMKKSGTVVYLLWQVVTVEVATAPGFRQECILRAVCKTPVRAENFKTTLIKRDQRRGVTCNVYNVDPVLTDHLFRYVDLLGVT